MNGRMGGLGQAVTLAFLVMVMALAIACLTLGLDGPERQARGPVVVPVTLRSLLDGQDEEVRDEEIATGSVLSIPSDGWAREWELRSSGDSLPRPSGGATSGVSSNEVASAATGTEAPGGVQKLPAWRAAEATSRDEASLWRGSVATEVTDEGEVGRQPATSAALPPSTATPEAIQWPVPQLTAEAPPHVLTVEEPSPYAALARCGVPCWGERMTHAEVEALALRVTGDPVWSSWAAWCFSTPGGESGGYVGAVAGPNYHRDGGISWDLGVGQSSTRTLAGLGRDAARVLVDPEYAMDALYATWLAQGYGAWFGCASDGGGE